MSYINESVIYNIYPLGFCGAPKENDGKLVYRLDKIQKITGLDLRIFDQAIIFKVAMMVNKYLTSNTTKI